ncbi:hypothetical protein [Marinimicrobium agarilyticum]|uniref:hypothetical protein n=1 Tax=Marinimicrobium agarilyticum TaxID=306546 RepID=UPI0004233C5C|nr:hypothetical protein [Marinimicrobium agarilyticum]
MFEWTLLILVISVIVTLAVGVYSRMAEDVRQLSFKLAAQNFETAVSGVRAKWYVQRSQGDLDYTVTVYGQLPSSPVDGQEMSPVEVYLNRSGWPVNTASAAQAQDRTLEVWECAQLWNGLLYQAPKVEIEGQESAETGDYEVSAVTDQDEKACRYRHLLDESGRQYFDYFPRNGRVVVYSSP